MTVLKLTVLIVFLSVTGKPETHTYKVTTHSVAECMAYYQAIKNRSQARVISDPNIIGLGMSRHNCKTEHTI